MAARIGLMLLALCAAAISLRGQPAGVLIEPMPAWTRLAEWKATTLSKTNEKTEGTHYLLYEHQQHPQAKEDFQRNVLLMWNETGVQDSGNLSFYFDPNYQKLVLHRVQIHRNGQVLDRLDRTKIKLVQREAGLGLHIYTGRQTALLFVEDLRVGDVLEYAFTTRGANPIMGDHFSTRLAVRTGVALDRQRIRIVWSGDKPLHVRQHRVEVEAKKAAVPGGTEYVWDFANLEMVPYEDYTPPSYEPYPYLELSDFDSWARVVEWALPLYDLTGTMLPVELEKLIKQWQNMGSTRESSTMDSTRESSAVGSTRELSARLALQFVQDDLRYTGLEMGPDSYKPAPPAETFERRFGDCKGKVLLLCAILRAMNLEASPALVNSYLREAIGRRLPSPFAFDHVIVKLNLNGKIVWLDPTISHQGGPLWTRHVSPFGQALVIQPGVTALETITRPPGRTGGQEVKATFKILDYEAPVDFTVTTTYRGAEADNMREELARADKKEMVKANLNYYARFYPGIHDPKPLVVFDNRERNDLSVSEYYRITNLWTLSTAGNQWEASLFGESLVDQLPEPSTRLRTRPLRLPYPLYRSHEVTVHLPDRDWQIPTTKDEVQHNGFLFRHERMLRGSILRLTYECETRAAEVPLEHVATYFKKVNEMEGLLADSLFRRASLSRNFLADVNWMMVVIAGFAAGAALAGGIWVWRRARWPAEYPPLLPDEQKLQGIGGWLILVAIGMCLTPFVRAHELSKSWDGYFSIQAWRSAAMPGGEQFHALFGPLLIFEVLCNVVLLGLSLLTACLFFRKRQAFPRTFIVLMFGNAAYLWIDYIIGGMIPSVAELSSAVLLRAALKATLTAMVWSAYMMKSRRVKLTFRDVRMAPGPPPIPYEESQACDASTGT
jgi:hypothetical protein